jgi:hypothetical protein
VDERQHRLGLNEALFREVNERIERVSETLQVTTSEKLAILCECGDESCTERVDVFLPDYERIRQDSTLFFVRPGHEAPDVEAVVEHGAGWDVVRKKAGEPAELARELDPRTD